MYQLGMKLARFEKNREVSRDYEKRAKMVWRFMRQAGIIDQTNFKVRSGGDTPTNVQLAISRESSVLGLRWHFLGYLPSYARSYLLVHGRMYHRRVD